jgi:hypothetical protein
VRVPLSVVGFVSVVVGSSSASGSSSVGSESEELTSESFSCSSASVAGASTSPSSCSGVGLGDLVGEAALERLPFLVPLAG